jgi:hypothetical protein
MDKAEIDTEYHSTTRPSHKRTIPVYTMAPRQRISSMPSIEDVAGKAQQRALLSDESSAGSDESNGESRHVKSPSTAPQNQQTPADIARDEHDLFNLVALVSSYWDISFRETFRFRTNLLDNSKAFDLPFFFFAGVTSARCSSSHTLQLGFI